MVLNWSLSIGVVSPGAEGIFIAAAAPRTHSEKHPTGLSL